MKTQNTIKDNKIHNKVNYDHQNVLTSSKGVLK